MTAETLPTAFERSGSRTPNLDALTSLLRTPHRVADELVEGRALRTHARAAIAAVALGGAVFGAVVGSHRGGEQLLYAALKLPLVMLLALSLTVPAVHGLCGAFERGLTLAQVSAVVLASTARASLVLMALAPAVALGIALGFGYHDVALSAAIAFGLAALAGFVLLRRAIAREGGFGFVVLLCVFVQAVVTMQAAWTLRPWLVRPSSEVVFVRAPDGNALESVTRTAESAAGVYDPARSRERARERAGRP